VACGDEKRGRKNANEARTGEDRMLIWAAILWLACAAIFLEMVERAPALD